MSGLFIHVLEVRVLAGKEKQIGAGAGAKHVSAHAVFALFAVTLFAHGTGFHGKGILFPAANGAHFIGHNASL
jgi:hypothetical protein